LVGKLSPKATDEGKNTAFSSICVNIVVGRGLAPAALQIPKFPQRREQGLACGLRSGRGSDSPPGTRSLPRPSLRYPALRRMMKIFG
jgi:hypothetical protein